ncbi:MAG: SDR family oxidoreductase [Cyclobacteriaceae bacterium]|nr:SDR family oxidoreductase [Cyclobacteriaceae bacterium]
MRILITGANGLLGHKLVEILAADKLVELIATSRGKSRLPEKWNLDYQEMDVNNANQVSKIISSVKPDVIIHTAAMTNVDDCELNQSECYDLNVKSVEILLRASKEIKAFFVHLSTDFIFSGEKGPLTEDESPKPVNYYGESKLESETIVKSYPYKWAIVRTVLVYGITPNMSRSNIILWVKKSLEEGKTIQVVDDQFRTPTLAEDLAKGCIAIAKGSHEGVFNISGKDFLTPYEMAIATAEFFGLNKNLIVKTDSSKFTQPAKRPLRTGFILDKAINTFGYAPVSFKEGIQIVADQIQRP